MSSIMDALQNAQWVGFDLDDTLHDFRGASKKATNEVLSVISNAYPVTVESLKAEYSTILRGRSSSAFTDGKTSHEYRAERFQALLRRFALPTEESFIEQLTLAYEKKNMESLTLLDGAMGLLDAVRAKVKKVMVVTEGPQDAQERTVNRLLPGKVDIITTTNMYGVSKVDGLFPTVLGHFGIAPNRMVYIGDSMERDVIPAQNAGIFAVHFCPKSQEPSSPFTIKDFSELKEIVDALG